MESFLEPYKLLWRHRKLLGRSVAQTLRSRFAGSALGVVWLIAGPAILLCLYSVIYTVIFKVRPINLSVQDYVFYIFSGLVPLIAFGQALGGGANSLSADRGLLFNKIFPAAIIPAREVLGAGVFVLVGGGIILLIRLLLGAASWTWLLLPVILLLLAMATMGVVWGLAIANLVTKDVQHMIRYVMIILLISSPIAYTPEMVPPNLRFIIYANPFAYYVQSFQSVLVLGRVPSPTLLVGCVVIAFVSFHGMYRVFNVGKRIIADHI